MPMVIFVYRTVSNFTIIAMVTIWMFIEFECPRCTDYADREEYLNDLAIFTLFIYSWLCVAIIPVITLYLKHRVFQKDASSSRDLPNMIAAQNWSGILELQLYNANYDVYDDENNITLLMLAMREKRTAIAVHLLRKVPESQWGFTDHEEHNLLDHYCKPSQSFVSLEPRSMLEPLLTIYKALPHLKSSDGKNAFLCGCANGLAGVAESFANEDPNVLFSADNNDINILDHYVGEHGGKLDLSADNLFDIQEAKEDNAITDKELGRNAFMCVMTVGNQEMMHAFVERYINGGNDDRDYADDDFADSDGRTIEEYLYKSDFYMDGLDYIRFYADRPQYLQKSGIFSPFFYACKKNNISVVASLIETYPQLVRLSDRRSYNVLDYYVRNPRLLSAESLLSVYREYPEITTMQKAGAMTVFLCACYHGDSAAVEQLITFDKGVLTNKNSDGLNGVAVAMILNNTTQQSVIQYLRDEHNLVGTKPRISSGTLKVMLIGAGNVGKSTILRQIRYLYRKEYNYTYGMDSKRRSIFYQSFSDMKLCVERLQNGDGDGAQYGSLSVAATNCATQLMAVHNSSYHDMSYKSTRRRSRRQCFQC